MNKDNEDMELEVVPLKPMSLENKLKAEQIIKSMINKPSIQAMLKESFRRLIMFGGGMTQEEIQTAIKAAENE
ncbi:MAG TPA: hypothetical protein VJ279_08370 [Hanamia sp.]|jgi:hypothetical protein|nr:hypothetical protein [Hanamia sp.]